MSKKRYKRHALSEFRYNNSTGHPDYIFEESNNKYHSLGLTHDNYTFGKKNMPLHQNPKKKDFSPAYIRNGVNNSRKRNYSKKPIKNMTFSKDDFKNVKAKIRYYKKRRKKKQVANADKSATYATCLTSIYSAE